MFFGIDFISILYLLIVLAFECFSSKYKRYGFEILDMPIWSLKTLAHAPAFKSAWTVSNEESVSKCLKAIKSAAHPLESCEFGSAPASKSAWTVSNEESVLEYLEAIISAVVFEQESLLSATIHPLESCKFGSAPAFKSAWTVSKEHLAKDLPNAVSIEKYKLIQTLSFT